MNQKGIVSIVAVVIAIIVIIAGAALGRAVLKNRFKNPAPSPSPTLGQKNPCSAVPAEYKSQCEQLNSWLDKKLVEWKPKEYGPMKFNGHLQFSSENSVTLTNSDMDSKFFDLVNELNTDTVSLFIYPDNFKKYESRYDVLIGKIRESGKKLYVAYMVGDNYKYRSFKEYKDTESNFTKMFVEKYHPDYYIVADEITTMNKRAGINASNDEWKRLVIDEVSLVKKISPQTKTAVIGHSMELAFLKSLVDINELEYIGFNIWGAAQIDTSTPIGKDINNAIKYVEANGKGVIFEQTWLTLMDDPKMKALASQDFIKELDAKYVRAIVYYANSNSIDIYGTFYLGKFVYYNTDDPAGFNSALDMGQRTPVFYEYKSVIEEFKNRGTAKPTATPAANSENPCESVSAQYKSQCEQLNSWLDKKLIEWKPKEYKAMDFAAYHTLASFPNVRNADLNLLRDYTAGLEESGADTIVVYMDGTPFLKNDKTTISKWDAVVAKIKSDGKKLYIAYIPDVKGSDLKNWETYKSVETGAIREIIKKYSPDSFVVLNEPSTIERELSFKPAAEQWAALASDSADLVKNLNSKTKINIQITGDDLAYFDKLINAKNINGVGFNIYGFRAFDTFTPYIASVKNAGKTPMLSETWKMFKDNQKYDGMDSLDAKWAKVAAYYAQTNGMSYMNPFFTFYFFVSPADVRNQPAFLSKLESNLANGNRAKSFLEYQAVISEINAVPRNGNPISTPKPTTTPNSTATPTPNSGNPCGSAPSQYKTQCEQLNSWLDQKIAAWKLAKYKPMDFAVYDLLSSDDMFVKMNAATDAKFLGAVEGVNANIVVLYIRPKDYLSQKARYDSLINKIKADGKKLFIGARFGDEPMTFVQYGEELDKYARDIIAAIKPDYFGIVMEPATMEKKHGFSATDEQWRDLVNKTAGLSKQLSPATKTVADGHKEELNFLRLAADLSNMDIIGFNIYDSTGIYDEYSGYLGKGDVVGKTIDYANSKGKKTWILETWVTDCSSSPEKKKACTSEFMKGIDAKWVRVISYYAQKHNMDAITPFFTGKFVYYGESQSGFDSAINNGERTPVFYEYKSVIDEIKIMLNRD